jgi:hypothetical protein
LLKSYQLEQKDVLWLNKKYAANPHALLIQIEYLAGLKHIQLKRPRDWHVEDAPVQHAAKLLC